MCDFSASDFQLCITPSKQDTLPSKSAKLFKFKRKGEKMVWTYFLGKYFKRNQKSVYASTDAQLKRR